MIPEENLKIYLAGTFTTCAKLWNFEVDAYPDLDEKQVSNLLEYPFFLESFHYIGTGDKHVSLIQEKGRKVFLDSGAFSMVTKGVTIPIEKYANFVENNQPIIEVASVLDGIGNAEETFANQNKLEELGADVLPCFHYGEDTKYLTHYIENYTHITLGGMVPISTKDLYPWLDEIWGNFLTNSDGTAKLKVHGFGLTTHELMLRYPWYSVDSTSWVMIAMFGNICHTTWDNKETILCVSDQSPNVKKMGKHVLNISPSEREFLEGVIERNGFTLENLKTNYWHRWLYNIQYYKRLCSHARPRFVNREQGLF